MAPPASSPEATRKALLDAATAEFAERGYELARVRDIVRRAGANVAAINYHFGGKQGLYTEVLRTQASARIDRFPFVDTVPSRADAEAALRAAITALLSRFLADDERSIVPRLMLREFSQPSPALDALIRDIIEPQFRQLSAVVAVVLGPRASDETVLRCALSVVSQCIFYLFARPLVRHLAPRTYDDGVVERLAQHIASFSIAALRAQRQQLEASS